MNCASGAIAKTIRKTPMPELVPLAVKVKGKAVTFPVPI
jgi:hypothetical protein